LLEAHGDLSIEVERNIISVSLFGSFNETGVENWTQKLRVQIEHFGVSSFFILMDNLKYEGFTPLGFEVSNEFNLWLCNQPMKAKAIVQPSLLARKINISNIPALKKQRIEYFEDKDNALAWLKSFPEYLTFTE
jgi:hypothetical protein